MFSSTRSSSISYSPKMLCFPSFSFFFPFFYELILSSSSYFPYLQTFFSPKLPKTFFSLPKPPMACRIPFHVSLSLWPTFFFSLTNPKRGKKKPHFVEYSSSYWSLIPLYEKENSTVPLRYLPKKQF